MSSTGMAGSGLSGGIVASTYSGNNSGPSGSTANEGAYNRFSSQGMHAPSSGYGMSGGIASGLQSNYGAYQPSGLHSYGAPSFASQSFQPSGQVQSITAQTHGAQQNVVPSNF
ncbi:hypothetical protein, partial [Paenibacillus thiaminolyticus]|nr:hypothetical protein [Paenibacillus thiaminolyticus]